MNGLAAFAGFAQEKNDVVLRAIDKLDKIQWEGVREELLNKSSVGLEETQADAIKKFLDLQNGSTEEKLLAAEALMSNSPQAKEGIAELREIAACVKALGVSDDKWVVDLSVARGLGYYTGPVFETVLTDLPSMGSVFSGGRYDDLVNRFGSANMPATGASVGIDRLFAAMEKLKIVPTEMTVSKVMILNFSPDCRFLVQAAAADLRRAGIPTEMYLGTEVTLKGQLSAAVKQNIPYVVIIGDEEKTSGKAQVKDMSARTQNEVSLGEVVAYIAKLVK